MRVRLLVASFVSLGLTWSASSFASAYKIDPAQSTVKWAAEKVLKKLGGHDGIVRIKEGTLDLEGKQDKGRFVIDMTSIESLDLKKKDPVSQKKLENHLKSDDFFSVSKYPEATLVIKSLNPDPKVKTDYQAVGDLTIKGITKPVTLPATIIEKDGKVKITGNFTINRLDWDIRYNSPDFLDLKKLGDKAIKNEVAFDIDLTGQKK
jgi:polyisoprenoid-binding protein YceI